MSRRRGRPQDHVGEGDVFDRCALRRLLRQTAVVFEVARETRAVVFVHVVDDARLGSGVVLVGRHGRCLFVRRDP